jgi:hypothetical protein
LASSGELTLQLRLQVQKLLHRGHREKAEANLRKQFASKGTVAPSRRPIKFLTVAVLLCLALQGCAATNSSDLTGTWTVKDESRHRFLSSAQQKGAAKITLNANGSFAASEVPADLMYGPPAPADGIVTGSGTWKLLSRDGRQQIQLNFEAITTGQRGEVPYGTQLNVSRGWSSLDLFYVQDGDADQGKRIEFGKK